MTLYITIVNLNCEPLKQGLKIYMVFFIKYILYKESYKHFNFPPLLVLHKKWFNVECYRDWLLQMQIPVCSGKTIFIYLFIAKVVCI